MPLLTIDLQEGFDHDHVKIEVDGQRIFDQDNVRTRPEIGFAARAELQVGAGPRIITIELPKLHLATQASVDAGSTGYLGVSLDDGSVVLNPSKTMFGYL